MSMLTVPEAARRLAISYTRLRAMLAEAPPDLPGRPIPIGGGRRRAHLRWATDDLEVWIRAYGEWRRGAAA